jgi:excisionase family DNA binding protein
MKKLLSVREVAELLGMHTDTVYTLLRRGDIVGMKMPGLRGSWKVEEAAIERFVMRRTYRP